MPHESLYVEFILIILVPKHYQLPLATGTGPLESREREALSIPRWEPRWLTTVLQFKFYNVRNRIISVSPCPRTCSKACNTGSLPAPDAAHNCILITCLTAHVQEEKSFSNGDILGVFGRQESRGHSASGPLTRMRTGPSSTRRPIVPHRKNITFRPYRATRTLHQRRF